MNKVYCSKPELKCEWLHKVKTEHGIRYHCLWCKENIDGLDDKCNLAEWY